MSIPLEDNVSDILEKRNGAWGSPTVSSRKDPAWARRIRKLRDGYFDDDAIERAAPVLKLDATALRKLATGNGTRKRSAK